MTLAQSTRYKLYQPVVLTDEYIITFPIFSTADITVFIDGVETALYSITATFAGGRAENAVLTLNAAVTDVDVEIYGTRTPRRENQYNPNSPNLSDNLQNDVDAVTAVQQEQARDFAGIFRLSPSVQGVSPLAVDAAARAGRALNFTADGLGLEAGPTAADIAGAQGFAAKAKEWAENDEDAEVQAGQFSAKHHAAKAAATAAAFAITEYKTVPDSRLIVASDNTAFLSVDSSVLAMTLDAAATLGNRFWFDIEAKNNLTVSTTDATNIVTDLGAAQSLKMRSGEIVRFYCSGTGFRAARSGSGFVEEIFISSATNILPLDVPFGCARADIEFFNYKPSVDLAFLAMQYGTNGASGSFFTVANSYRFQYWGVFPAFDTQELLGNNFPITPSQENGGSAERRGFGDLKVQGFWQAGKPPVLKGFRSGKRAPDITMSDNYIGRMAGNTPIAVNAIRFFSSSGNIDTLQMRIEWKA